MYRIGIAGYGAIGQSLAKLLDKGIDGLQLSAIAVRDPVNKAPDISHLVSRPKIITIDELESPRDHTLAGATAALPHRLGMRAGRTAARHCGAYAARRKKGCRAEFGRPAPASPT